MGRHGENIEGEMTEDGRGGIRRLIKRRAGTFIALYMAVPTKRQRKSLQKRN